MKYIFIPGIKNHNEFHADIHISLNLNIEIIVNNIIENTGYKIETKSPHHT
jgi:hypothetical protein